MKTVWRDEASAGTDEAPQALAGQFIKVEANLLRLPLFALGTKGLKQLNGIECSGRITRNDQVHAFTFRATRSSEVSYPGPLSRSVHLALLSLISDQGFPFANPLSWTWRDLCRRLRVVYGGQMVGHLKEAIRATAGLFLWSEYALYSKADAHPIANQHDGLHLYDRVTFAGMHLPDGREADSNLLFLSEWYVQNLNSFFTAPLDYELWRFLDQQSPIASRLYEFLLLHFYANTPVLRMNYETLVRFLPVRAESYLSSAKKQLGRALELLATTGVVHRADWEPARKGIAQLHFHRGERLPEAQPRQESAGTPFRADLLEDLEVRELRAVEPPEGKLVREFYRLWVGDGSRKPSGKELELAREILQHHGPEAASALVAAAVKRLKVAWPEAKTFGAVAPYLPDALKDREREERRQQAEAAERRREASEKEEQAQTTKERAALKVLWDTVPEAERESVRQAVLARQPRTITKFPDLLERFYLEELARRREPDRPRQ